MPKVSGVDRAVRRLRKLGGGQLVDDVTQALYVGGQNVQSEAQLFIVNGAKSGRIYKRKDESPHQASSPGEAPADDVGTLAAHIEAAIVKPLHVEVTSSASYARDLEYGTSKMAARPYMKPALEVHRKNIKELVNGAIRKNLRES